MPVARSGCLLAGFAISSLVTGFGSSASAAKQDAVWKRYYNAEAKYCVSYPSHWYKADAFDGSGLYVIAGVKKHSRATGEIDLGIVDSAASANQAHATAIKLTDDFASHLDVLKKFERADRVEVLDQHTTQVAGNPALFTKDRYYDPQDRSTWLEEILFVQRNQDLYRLELECKADQIARFEPVFSQFVNSLEFDCVNSH
jgi:hypothetical protein